jgi:uncharacterized protein YndB with AHSA1/START domain
MPTILSIPAEFLNERRYATDNGLMPTDLADAVRRAVSRDVELATNALTTWPHPDPSQRVAIARHLSWIAEGIVREGGSTTPLNNPASEVAAAASRYAGDAAARTELISALGPFAAELASAPGTGSTIAFDPGGLGSRAATAQWLTDGDGLGPAARAYRREAFGRWYLPRHSGLKRSLGARVGVDVAAPVEAVWRVVADPTRTSEWSHECRWAEFLDGATESGLGVRFKGSSRSGRTTWSRTCTIFDFEPNRAFGYLTSGAQGDATAWHFRLEPTASGTRLEQAYQIVAMPRWMSLVLGVVMPSHDDRRDALREDLCKIGALAEQGDRRGPAA